MADRASSSAPFFLTPGISVLVPFFCLFGWGFCWGFVLEGFFVSRCSACTAATPAFGAGCAPAEPWLCRAGGGSWFVRRGRVVPAVPPAAFPSGRPAGLGRLLASSRTPDAAGRGSAWRVKLGVRPRLCRSSGFAEPGGCVVRRTSPRNLNKGTKSCLPPPQNNTQTPGAAVASPLQTATEKKHKRLFKFLKCKTA